MPDFVRSILEWLSTAPTYVKVILVPLGGILIFILTLIALILLSYLFSAVYACVRSLFDRSFVLFSHYSSEAFPSILVTLFAINTLLGLAKIVGGVIDHSSWIFAHLGEAVSIIGGIVGIIAAIASLRGRSSS